MNAAIRKKIGKRIWKLSWNDDNHIAWVAVKREMKRLGAI
jgi:hypothetical protein